MWVIKQIMNEVKENKPFFFLHYLYKTLTMIEIHSLILPFAGAKCNNMLKSVNRCLKRIVPNDVNTRITYK